MARAAFRLQVVVPFLLILSMSSVVSGWMDVSTAKNKNFVLNKCTGLLASGDKVYADFCARHFGPCATAIAGSDAKFARVAMRVDLNYAKKAEAAAAQVLRDTRVQSNEKEAVNHCLNGLKEVLTTLREARGELQKPRPVVDEYDIKVEQSLSKCRENLVTPSVRMIVEDVSKATIVSYLLYN